MNRLTDDYKCHTPPLATNKVPFVTPPQECLIAPPVQVPGRSPLLINMDEEDNNDDDKDDDDDDDDDDYSRTHHCPRFLAFCLNPASPLTKSHLLKLKWTLN